MNIVFFFIVVTAFFTSAYHQIFWIPDETAISPMAQMGTAMIEAASGAVELAIGLIGVMTLFLGVMKVGEAAGLLRIIAKLLRPILTRLFPDVPPEHPAMGAMVMNISANALGLGNAATPFGIRAMHELNRLNETKGVATNAMVLFLAINTSSVTLLPTGVIAMRAAAGSVDPAGILPTTLFATICSTIVAITAAKVLERFVPIPKNAKHDIDSEPSDDADEALPDESTEAYPAWASWAAIGAVIALVPLSILYGKAISPWIVPLIMFGLLSFGFARGVRVYEVMVEGAKEGFQIAIRITPYLVAILVAVAMFRASGAMEFLVGALSTVTAPLGLPAEALPMAFLRPLSGTGAFGYLASILNDPAIGPDSYVGYLVSTFQGSTETTFYVIAVYFGAAQIRNSRHALGAALLADLAGIMAATFIVFTLYG